MDSLEVERVSIAFFAHVAGHLDRLLLSVSCGKDTQSAAKSNSLPSNQRPHDLDLVYWTPGPTWKSSHRDRMENREFCGQEERRRKTKSCKANSGPLQNHLKPHVVTSESSDTLCKSPVENCTPDHHRMGVILDLNRGWSDKQNYT